MFISTVVCLVPVVDCSEAVGVVEMTEVTVTFCMFFVAYINFITIMQQVAVFFVSFHINLLFNSY